MMMKRRFVAILIAVCLGLLPFVGDHPHGGFLRHGRSFLRGPATSDKGILSDSDIITDADVSECNQLAPGSSLHTSVTSPVNPQQAELPDDGEVWRVGTNRWTPDFEKMYADWVRTKVDADFMKRNQFKVDCADATAIVRAVFARIYHLPLLFSSNTAEVSNATKTWAHVPTIAVWNADNWQTNLLADQRFREFIKEVSSIVHIEYMPLNTYPVKLTDETHSNSLSSAIQPGTVIMNTHHAEFVKDIDKTLFDPLIKMNSTSPAAIRTLWVEPMDIEYPVRPELGFVNWSWSVNCGPRGWKHVQDTRMPGYSQEQFQYDSFEQYNAQELVSQASENDQKVAYLKQELSTRNYNGQTQEQVNDALEQAVQDQKDIAKAQTFKQDHPGVVVPESYHNFVQILAHDGTLPRVTKTSIQESVNSIVDRIKRRADYVNEALKAQAANPNVFTGKNADDDDYSTPDFDSSDKTRILRLLSMLEGAKGNEDITEDQFKNMLASEWVDIGSGKKVNAYYYSMAILVNNNGNYISSEPGDPLESRWGFKWVQEHAHDLTTQLAAAKQSESDAQKKLTDYQNAHPLTGTFAYAEFTAKAKAYANWLPDSPSTQFQASYDSAKGRADSLQSELNLIQSNYGISAQ
jgi:hypothetical protein